MIFEFSGAPELAAPREAVWRHLQDSDIMAACTPGAESFEVLGPGRYSVRCSVGAGLLRAHVVLEAEMHDLVHPESLQLRATGTAPGSTLDVATQVRLKSLPAERTRLEWSSTTGVHGMLAGLGRGMVEDTLRHFTETFWANVAARVAAAPRRGPFRMSAEGFLTLSIETLSGAVLLTSVEVDGCRLSKGHRLTAADATALRLAAEADRLAEPIHLAWIGADELHEADAADLLAAASAGPGVAIGTAHQGRVNLTARHAGVLQLALGEIHQVNAIDPLELFTRWAFQPVEAGELVASMKTAPHVVDRVAVEAGIRLAEAHPPLVDVRAYAGVSVAAIVAEQSSPESRARFEAASRLRAESLGGSFEGILDTSHPDPLAAEAASRAALEELALQKQIGLLLIGGVSAGDPLAPLFAALEGLGGTIVRRGVPSHPGSMLWLGQLGQTQLLGLPRCAAFGMATAADLLLPRLMSGEVLSAESIADLGHGGLLGPEMRARFPRYARDLPEPPVS